MAGQPGSDLTALRADFPILDTTFDGVPLSYLDNAATTQKPASVLAASENYYLTANSTMGRSAHTMSVRATEAWAAARETVGGFINAGSAFEIVFTKNATESINMVALAFEASLVAGDNVVITGMEHHSNLLTWRRLCERTGASLRVVPTDELGRITMDGLRDTLTRRTRLVAVAHVSNVLGTVNPVREIVAEAHRHDIPVLVDGAQAVAHRAVDVRDLDADFYCFSGHKMYGPLGIGVLYGKAERLERLDVVLTGGGVAQDVSFADPVTYFRVPHRLEPGTPNIGGAVGLAAAVGYLQAVGMDRVAEHDAELTAHLAARLRDVDGVRVLGEVDHLRGAIVTFVVDGLHPYDVGSHLNTYGIAVRSGVQCAMPFTDLLGVVGTVRASFGIYNTVDEADRLVEAVRTAEPGFWTKEHPNDRFL